MVLRNAKDAYVDLRGLRFHYRDWAGEGKPLVLLHGLASTSHIWDLTAPFLSRRLRLFALDQRGHGESDKPDEGYDFDSTGGDLRAFVDALGLTRPVILGHSWGGSVALRYAAEQPEALAGLVLVDGGYVDLSAWLTWEEAEKELAPPRLDGVPLDAFLKNVRSLPYFADIWSPQVEQIVLANFEIGDERTIRPRLRRENHMKIVRALYDQSPSELYGRVRCPVLLIIPERVPRSEWETRWLERRRQGVQVAQEKFVQLEVVRMEDTIHDIPLQRPQELAAFVERFAANLP